MNAIVAFKVTREGFGIDPTGAQVVWEGRLFDIIQPLPDAATGEHCVMLRTFDRSQMFKAPVDAIDVLDRQEPQRKQVYVLYADLGDSDVVEGLFDTLEKAQNYVNKQLEGIQWTENGAGRWKGRMPFSRYTSHEIVRMEVE